MLLTYFFNGLNKIINFIILSYKNLRLLLLHLFPLCPLIDVPEAYNETQHVPLFEKD